MEEWFGRYDWALWVGAALALGVAELASLNLVLLMLAVGCLVGAGVGAAEQAMLVLVRPSVVRRLHSGPTLVQGHAALVGCEGFAVSAVDAHGGQVKLAGEVWTARPYDETAVIPSGAKVEVFEIRCATAYVHEVPQLGA